MIRDELFVASNGVDSKSFVFGSDSWIQLPSRFWISGAFAEALLHIGIHTHESLS